MRRFEEEKRYLAGLKLVVVEGELELGNVELQLEVHQRATKVLLLCFHTQPCRNIFEDLYRFGLRGWKTAN